jgi:hypothetical protein
VSLPWRQRAGLVTLGVAAVLAAACGSNSRIAAGADTSRPRLPSMDLVRFDDVAASVGLDFEHGSFHWSTNGDPASYMGGGLCWIDYDNDGWLDLFAVNTWTSGEWGRWRDAGGLPTSRLYRNDHGQFVDVTDRTAAGLEVRGNGCVAADLDGDGHTDLYVTTDRANVLLWNDGGKRFVDGSVDAGVDAYGWHTAIAAGDLNGDGLIDLFVAGYADANRRIAGATKGFPNSFEPEADLVFLNQGAHDGARPTFRNVANLVGVESDQLDYGLGAVMSDVDDDGDLDVFVANDTNPNRLYLNSATATDVGFRFDEIGDRAGVDDDNAGMGVAIADYSGDDRPDIAVTNLGAQLHNVLRSDGPGSGYVDALGEIGLPQLGSGLTGWGITWFDADLDTDLDLLIVHGEIPIVDLVADSEPMRFYENHGDATFGDVSALTGIDAVGPRLARGAAAADYDNDGDVDVAVATIGGPLTLLRNTGAGGHWITVAPSPPTPGTLVTVASEGEPNQRHAITAGSSYLSSEDPRAIFGLGTATDATLVTVRWPDGAQVTLDAVRADRIITVEHP